MQKNKSKNSFRNNWYVLRLIWKVCPGRVIADFILSAINYASWVFYSVVFIKYIMGAIEAEKGFIHILSFLIISTSIFGIGSIFDKWYQSEYRLKTDALLYEKINKLLFDKATEVELACYEDTEFYNMYTLAMKETDTRISSVLETFAAIVFGIIAGIGVLINMYSIDHYVVLFVLSPLIGNFVIGKWLNELMFQRSKECVPYQREMDYVNRAVYLADYAKEMRMSNIFNVLSRNYERGYEGVVTTFKKYQNKAVSLNVWSNIFTFLIIFQGVMLYSLYKTMVTKTISLSSFAVLSSAMVSAAWILIGLSKNIITYMENGLYVDNLQHFLEYQPKLCENQEGLEPKKETTEISFHQVGFTYHGAKEQTLKALNFTIHKNEKIAIVGHNGAGKTTLIKLLMRLYDPTEGTIAYNGINIKEYNVKQYRSLFGTAFQDYQVFAMTVAENVLMRAPGSEQDYELVKDALTRSYVYDKISSLPKGMDTILTKEFDKDGAVLSGGEYQKIAIARAYAKDFEIAVFDEPSSALDPIAEYQLYESIMEACKDKTVIFISHRLSSAVLADRIYLFDNGRIIEEGSHTSLMELNGQYADMFRKQAEKYQEEEEV